MAEQRPIPFRAVVVHKPAPGAARPASAPRGRLSFTDMLRRGGSKQESRAMRSGVVAPDPDDLFDDLPEPSHAALMDEKPHEEDDGGFDEELMPTPEAMQTLLAQAPQPVLGIGDKPPQAPDAIHSLAKTIAGFCNERAVQDSEGWSVHIDLRPDVIAQTSLDLTVSSHWLQLRFKAAQPASRRLLCEHEGALRSQLDASLDRSRDIAISIE